MAPRLTQVMHTLSHARLIELPFHRDDNGDLVVMEGVSHVPFAIARIFVVCAPAGAVRGQHAHRRCAQFMACSTGIVEVICDDGVTAATFVLDRPNVGLLVPQSLWAQETFRAAGSVLTVLCDRPYEAEDYIRDYNQFLAYRSGTSQTRS